MCISVISLVTVLRICRNSPAYLPQHLRRQSPIAFFQKPLLWFGNIGSTQRAISARVDHHRNFLPHIDLQGDNHTVHLDRVFSIPLSLPCQKRTRTGWRWLTDLEELPYVPPLSTTELCFTLLGPQPRMDGRRIGQLLVHLARCLVVGLTAVSAGQS